MLRSGSTVGRFSAVPSQCRRHCPLLPRIPQIVRGFSAPMNHVVEWRISSPAGHARRAEYEPVAGRNTRATGSTRRPEWGSRQAGGR